MEHFTVIAQNGERRNFKKKSLDEVCADVRKYNKKARNKSILW